jgi:hypothetical protein
VKDWRLWLGGGAFASLLVWLHVRTLPPDPIVDPPATPAGPPRWVELDGPNVFLFTGDVYRACVNVPGVVPNSLVMSEIRKQAPGMGFKDITVQEGSPAGFQKATTPGGDCDVFVQATWNGKDGQVQARPKELTGAWRLARA